MLGIPILVSYTESEKNRLAEEADDNRPKPALVQPVQPHVLRYRRLIVTSIHPEIDEDRLRPIFEAYGALDYFSLLRDSHSDKSKGVAIVYYRDHGPARKALEQLDGLELAGKSVPIIVHFRHLFAYFIVFSHCRFGLRLLRTRTRQPRILDQKILLDPREQS